MRGATVKAVDSQSVAARGGIEVGDIITELDGRRLLDVFDWMWRSQGTRLELSFVRDDAARTIVLDRRDDEQWGIEFSEMLFDRIHTCANTCTFCFMDQLPAGLRDSLYLKDDDYRLSFYEGNFVTLTNMGEIDVARIVKQHMSPLHVSFHAADPDVRKRLMGKNHQRGLDVFEDLAHAGIQMHVSIVLVPHLNDGIVLDQTLRYLSSYRPHVLTVGVVPVAHTRFSEDCAENPPESFNEQQKALKVIEQIQGYQLRSRAETGKTWVHLADEFYIYARAPFPTSEWYDGYPQYENGIGIVHTYVEDIRAHYDELVASFGALPDGCEALTLITGELTVETMLGTLSAIRAGGKARLLPVENRFFGGNVNATGLLTGGDLVKAIRFDAKRQGKTTTYVIPRTVLNDDDLTLDDYTPSRIADQVDCPVLFVSDDACGLLDALAQVTR